MDGENAGTYNITMSLIRRFLNQRNIVWLLGLGIFIIVLLEFDSKLFFGRKTQHQEARMQFDRVVGSDFYQRARDQLNPNSDIILESGADDLSGYDLAHPLNFIPRVPRYSESDIVPYLNDSITKGYLKYPKRKYKENIVILTPICDVASHLERFSKLLANLSYPHRLILMFLGEDSSSDMTLDMATLIADELVTQHHFRRTVVFHFNISGGVHGNWRDIHHRLSQLQRRSHLAKARNLLLKVGLQSGEFDYILWIDSDITELPSDIIQQLLSANKDVVVPTCLYKSGKYKRNFDKNSWRETPTSLEDQSHLPSDILIVEGYSQTFRLYLPDLRKRVVLYR